MATAITDEQIASICRGEVDSASGKASGELAHERAEALDYYNGEPYGDEVEGRSQVVTREVMETVEWIMPSLARIFTDVDNMVRFEPVNGDDVEQAKIETEVVNHVYWKQNKGFYNTYAFLKDALLSKTGILKIYWDDSVKETKERYENLDDVQLGSLQNDSNIEREIIEFEELESGLMNVTFRCKTLTGKVQIEPVAPEEFGIARNARSPYVSDSNFCYHRAYKSFSELVQMGYDPDVIRTLPFDEDVETQEEIARRNTTDEREPYEYISEESMRMYWITECYVNIDRDGDDVAELLRVVLAGGHYTASSSRLLSIDEVDHMPFATVSPIPMPHKFFGMSLADLTMDLQRIKSVLTRQMLDNTYLANNSRTLVNDTHVNLDDLLTSRPGGVVRFKGEGAPQQYVTPIPHNALPPQAYQLMEYLDEVQKNRTGVGNNTTGLDTNSLAKVNTGVAMLAYDQQRMKIELIARIIAEIGFKDVFRIIHRLLNQHQDREMMINVTGKFIPVNPAEWRTRENTTVAVGMGTVSRERRMVAIEGIIQKQQQVAEAGGMGTIVQPHQMYQSLSDMVDSLGLEPSAYFTDPRTIPPKPPKPNIEAEIQLATAKALKTDADSKMLQVRVTAEKNSAEAALKMREQALKAQETQMKLEIENKKLQLESLQRETDMDTKVASLEMKVSEADAKKELKELELQFKGFENNRDREIEILKTQINALTKIYAEDLKQEGGKESSDLQAYVQNLEAENQRLREQGNTNES